MFFRDSQSPNVPMQNLHQLLGKYLNDHDRSCGESYSYFTGTAQIEQNPHF
jgi:hypothetical protein